MGVPMALQPPLLLLGRALIALLFVHEGFVKLGTLAGAQRYAALAGLPGWSIYPAIALEVGCGVMVLLGLGTRIGAILLALFSVVTAFLFHTKFGEVNQVLHFEKNLAIAGGLLALAVVGPGRWALETYGKRRGA